MKESKLKTFQGEENKNRRQGDREGENYEKAQMAIILKRK
jgi:hypothetical protein